MEKGNKDLKFEIKSQQEIEIDGNKYIEFVGLGAVFNTVDQGGDVILPSAFDKYLQLYKKGEKGPLPVLWQHDRQSPIGVYDEVEKVKEGLLVKGRLPMDDDFVKGRVAPQLRIKSITGLSIGYKIRKASFEMRDGERVRVLEQIDLFETSLVTFPMHLDARITAVKAAVPYQDLPLAEREDEWDSSAAVERVRKFTDSNETPSAAYKRAFLYYDKNEEDLFGAYKLPIADVIDGELMAVPRAIFAAAAALRGARGGVDIPREDRQKIVDNIEKYYKKMRDEFLDDNIVSPFARRNISKAESLKEIESYLKDLGLSNKEAKALISKVSELKVGRDGSTKAFVVDDKMTKVLDQLKKTL